MLKWLWLSFVVLVLDQITKYFADQMLQYHQSVPLIPMFNLTLSYNTGAAFSFLSEAGGWQRWFFTVLALVISVALVVWIKSLSQKERWNAIALSLILGGAIGNVIDRIIFGHVIDFLDVYYQQWHWPIFNIADSAISIGVAILIFEGLFGNKETGNRESDKNNKRVSNE
jgi:signal peptidase II